MHAYNRLPSSGHSSPSSPPASPLSCSPRYHHRDSKLGRPPPKTLTQCVAWIPLSGDFPVCPLLYIAGMLFYMVIVSFDVVPVIKHRLYAKIRPEMDSDNSTADAVPQKLESQINILQLPHKMNLQTNMMKILMILTRGTSSAKPSSGSPQVDLFGQDYVGDLLDTSIGVPTDKFTSLDDDPSEVDLFADADFVSAPPLPAGAKNPEPRVRASKKDQGTFIIALIRP